MKKVKLKAKILINGLFPLTNYEIDNYKFKIEQYNEKIIDQNDENYIFYSSDYVSFSAYSVEEKEGAYYNYFENDDYIEVEVDETIYNKHKELQDYILSYMIKKVRYLEKRLRLITNIYIGLPVFKITVYDENDKFITYVGHIVNHSSNLHLSKYDSMMKKLCSRLDFYISEEALIELEKRDSRYERAITFYNNSFLTNDIGIKFVLLFTSLESLFNTKGKKIKATIAKYTSKILFEESEKENEFYSRLLDLYKIRSSYIHGNNLIPITKEIEFELREIVRRTLLFYWELSKYKNINSTSDVKKFLDKNNLNAIKFELSVFKQMLDSLD